MSQIGRSFTSDDVRSLYTSIFKPAMAESDSRGRAAGWLIDPPTRDGDSAAFRKFETIGMLRQMRKRSPGPVDRCCRGSCTLNQLTDFCD